MLRALPLFFTLLQAEEAIPYVSNSSLYARSIIKSILIIILVLAGMYYWYKQVLPKVQSAGGIAPRNLVIKERLVIEPGTSVYVLEIKDEYKLLVVSNKQTAVYDLPNKKLKYTELPKKEFQDYLAELLKTKDNVKHKKGRANAKK